MIILKGIDNYNIIKYGLARNIKKQTCKSAFLYRGIINSSNLTIILYIVNRDIIKSEK
jgi:hypothetical protein